MYSITDIIFFRCNR